MVSRPLVDSVIAKVGKWLFRLLEKHHANLGLLTSSTLREGALVVEFYLPRTETDGTPFSAGVLSIDEEISFRRADGSTAKLDVTRGVPRTADVVGWLEHRLPTEPRPPRAALQRRALRSRESRGLPPRDRPRAPRNTSRRSTRGAWSSATNRRTARASGTRRHRSMRR